MVRLKLTDDQKWTIFELTVGLIILAIVSIVFYINELQGIDQANQVTVFYSRPFIEKISQGEYLVTVKVAVVAPYAEQIRIIPFLADPSRLDPALTFQGGFINEVLVPNVGYVNVTGQNVLMKAVYNEPIYDKKDPWFPSTNVTAFVFIVPETSAFNVTFVTNGSYVPVIWIAEPSPTSIGGLYTPIGVAVPLNGTPYYITP